MGEKVRDRAIERERERDGGREGGSGCMDVRESKVMNE